MCRRCVRCAGTVPAMRWSCARDVPETLRGYTEGARGRVGLTCGPGAVVVAAVWRRRSGGAAQDSAFGVGAGLPQLARDRGGDRGGDWGCSRRGGRRRRAVGRVALGHNGRNLDLVRRAIRHERDLDVTDERRRSHRLLARLSLWMLNRLARGQRLVALPVKEVRRVAR
eukprot:4040991-Pleurochrysis_carterae.AAC.1